MAWRKKDKQDGEEKIQDDIRKRTENKNGEQIRMTGRGGEGKE